jgi:hypothetical protein
VVFPVELCNISLNPGDRMTPELLTLAGEAIYGALWKAPMARDLNITSRHMSRIMNPNAKDRVTEKVRPVLLALLRQKAVEVATAIHTLETTDIDGISVVAKPK